MYLSLENGQKNKKTQRGQHHAWYRHQSILAADAAPKIQKRLYHRRQTALSLPPAGLVGSMNMVIIFHLEGFGL